MKMTKRTKRLNARAPVLALALLCLSQAFTQDAEAQDGFLLAFYLAGGMNGKHYVMQQNGIAFGIDQPHEMPVGRGGRGRWIIRLADFASDSGHLIVDIYSDEPTKLAATTPLRSLEVDFEIGTLGELKIAETDFNLEFAYSVVRR